MKIEIYTDGSCCGNPGPAGWGFLILKNDELVFEKFGPTHDSQGTVIPCTNQQSEMMALQKALELMTSRYQQGRQDPKDIIIYSDSAYLLNCFIKKWYVNWKKYAVEGVWLTSKKEPVCNQWLWESMLEMLYKFESRGVIITYTKVKGHTGNEYNERADGLANAGTNAAKELLLPMKVG